MGKKVELNSFCQYQCHLKTLFPDFVATVPWSPWRHHVNLKLLPSAPLFP